MTRGFEVDRKGLKSLIMDRPKSFMLRELVQNAWDEADVSRTSITLEQIPGTRKAKLVVEDDAPEGFYDITHAFTLFADTRKRKDPTQRGRFNLGEKQVLSMCESAEIVTTTAAIRFNADGTRTTLRGARREAGSVFTAIISLTKSEFEEICKTVKSFLPPAQIETLFKQLKQNFPLKYFLRDNVDAIEIQIWVSLIANLLISVIKSRLKRNWSFSNMASIIRQHLMNYIDIYKFLNDPEKAWISIVEKKKVEYQNSLFPKLAGAYF